MYSGAASYLLETFTSQYVYTLQSATYILMPTNRILGSFILLVCTFITFSILPGKVSLLCMFDVTYVFEHGADKSNICY